MRKLKFFILSLHHFDDFDALCAAYQKSKQTTSPECLIVCAYAHIGAQLKVKWRIEIFLCAFLKLDKNPLKMLLFLLNLKIQVINFY